MQTDFKSRLLLVSGVSLLGLCGFKLMSGMKLPEQINPEIKQASVVDVAPEPVQEDLATPPPPQPRIARVTCDPSAASKAINFRDASLQVIGSIPCGSLIEVGAVKSIDGKEWREVKHLGAEGLALNQHMEDMK